MRLVSYSVGGKARIGLLSADGEHVIEASEVLHDLPGSMIELISHWAEHEHQLKRLQAAGTQILPLSGVHLLPPVPRPGKILAIGLNYAAHVAEMSRERPEYQTWFCKLSSAANGPFDPIDLPAVSEKLDYEAELVVVIGRRCRHVPAAHARDVVFGYMAGNDVSVRDWQVRTPQWILGKSFDTHAPYGPAIVTADEVPDPHALGIRCLVNGEIRQDANTNQLLFPIWEQIGYLSQALTLEPGDLLFTGTPAGVAAGMKPPQWLKAGDRVRVEIDGVGAIENEVRPELTRR
ncbi:MAG: fumarylacetoacetate hydrolase family protein [Alphaproteobacteria bacterium]|nr:fumarylacetoacetate hydrolase family protein [Alphaproteobacteria bacterium]